MARDEVKQKGTEASGVMGDCALLVICYYNTRGTLSDSSYRLSRHTSMNWSSKQHKNKNMQIYVCYSGCYQNIIYKTTVTAG